MRKPSSGTKLTSTRRLKLDTSMDIYKHTAVSLVVSVLIMAIFRKAQMAVACFLAGVLMDADRVLDYYVNYGRSDWSGSPSFLRKFLSSLWNFHREQKQFRKVYKILHSVELLILFLLIYIFGIRNAITAGVLIGFTLHLIMDLVAFGHIGAVSLIYKINKGFPSGSDIVKHRLSRMGRDIDKCQICGTHDETVLRILCHWYIGFTRRRLNKITVLCSQCDDRGRNKDQQLL